MIKEETKFQKSSVFEGMTSIRAIISAIDGKIHDRKIMEIWLQSDRISHNIKEIGYLKAVSTKYGFSLIEKSKDEIDAVTTGNSHGGIIAFCSERTLPDAEKIDFLSNKGFYIYMDGIEDPYNFGYSIRSLFAFGVSGIILGSRNWMSASGVVARSSAGASEKIPIFSSDDMLKIIRLFKENGYKTVCAEEKTDVVLGNTELKLPLLLVVGGEKRGISKEILDLCDLKIKIPYQRDFKASLSAASATTVFAYEIARQNKY